MTLRLLLVHQLHPGTWGPPKASSTVAPRMSLHPEKGSDEGRWRGPHAAPCKPAQPLPLPRRGRLGVCLVPRLSFSCEGNSNAHPLQGCAARGLPPNHGSHQTHRRRKPREAKPPARGHTAGPAAAQTLGTWGGAGVWCLGRGPGSHGNAMSSESVLGRAGPKLRGPGPHDEQGCPPRVLSVGAAWRAGGTCVRPGVSRQRGVCSEEPAPGPQHRQAARRRRPGRWGGDGGQG